MPSSAIIAEGGIVVIAFGANAADLMLTAMPTAPSADGGSSRLLNSKRLCANETSTFPTPKVAIKHASGIAPGDQHEETRGTRYRGRSRTYERGARPCAGAPR